MTRPCQPHLESPHPGLTFQSFRVRSSWPWNPVPAPDLSPGVLPCLVLEPYSGLYFAREGVALSGHVLKPSQSVVPAQTCAHVSLARISTYYHHFCPAITRFYCHAQLRLPNFCSTSPNPAYLKILLSPEEEKPFLSGLQVCPPHPVITVFSHRPDPKQ